MTALPVWPHARAGEALTALAVAAGLAPRGADPGAAPEAEAALGAWLEDAGAFIGVEIEAVVSPYDEIDRVLAGAAPALIRVAGPEGAALLAVIRGERGRLVVLDPVLRVTRVAVADVRAALCRDALASAGAAVASVVDATGLDARGKQRVSGALVAMRLCNYPIAGMYLVRRPPEAPPRAHVRDRRLVARLSAILVLHGLAQILWIGSWWAIGRTVLGGTFSAGWLAAWGLLLASSQAARIGVTWSSGRIAIDAGALLAQRLLAGALRCDTDVIKRDGVGVALGRVLESNAVQSLAVSGGLQAMLAVVELVLAGVVLWFGAGGWLHAVLLVAVLGFAVLATRGYLAARRAWTEQRLELTHALAEAMVGHATRLAQGDLAALEDRDDQVLVRYHVVSRDMDRAQWRLGALIPFGWPVIAALGLAPVLVFGSPPADALAAALGGILFAAQAIERLVNGATRISDAAIAWRSVSSLFEAAAAAPDSAPPALALAPASPDAPALSARGIGYRHAGRGAPVLAACDLVVERGTHVLLEGDSGAGKSTLAAILAGLRRPESGLVLASGLDRASVGARGWRRRVACAPQFHDNHVFSAPLAFNLLLGRSWPPTADDLAASERICRELGLGPVLDRMPGGLFQQVGETGWQLSHGERSRVFLARALLQGAELVILDESLAALDPENLGAALSCMEARAPASVVIAHS
jgi:ATP-binding cassette subfamily B protein